MTMSEGISSIKLGRPGSQQIPPSHALEMQNWQSDMNQKGNKEGLNPTANKSMARANHSDRISNRKQKG